MSAGNYVAKISISASKVSLGGFGAQLDSLSKNVIVQEEMFTELYNVIFFFVCLKLCVCVCVCVY